VDDLCDAVVAEIGGGDHLSFIVSTFNVQVPVCLSGICTLHYKKNKGLTKHALCFISIIPEAYDTKILLGSMKEHDDALSAYMGGNGSFALLEQLETWMCHGSDHWFMTPSKWAAIPAHRKEAICERILDTTHSIT